MTQDTIVAILIAVAGVYAGYKLYRKLKPKPSGGCETTPSGCGGCGEDCTLRDLKKTSKK